MSDAIDYKQGLRHCDNQPCIYSAVLEQFRQQYQVGFKVQAILDDPQYAQLQLHTIKGLAATIGAQRLSQHAADVYQHWSVLDSDQRRRNLFTLEDQLQQVLQQIDLYLNSNSRLKN